MGDYHLSDDGAKTLIGMEAMVLHVYPDQAGIASVCVGHVVTPSDYSWINDGITRAECEDVLHRDVGRFERHQSSVVLVDTTQKMKDAMLILEFNIGQAGFEKSSVLKLLNEKNYEAAAAAFLLWKFVQVLQKDGTYVKKPILLPRREAESKIFLAGVAELLGMQAEALNWRDILNIVAKTQFGWLDLVPYHPAIEPEEPPPSNDLLSSDGRVICLPPDIADCEPLAA
jgi:lysozyme